jgi:muramoyltetrapeptide carboxypeptidase
LKIPNKIKVGDKIGLISTARKITMTEIQPAIDILKSWGLKIILTDSLFYEDHQFSGTIPQRTTALQLMIDDPSINAILCARGGYGTVQIIDSVNFSNLRKNPKWLIGYSDVTVLHSHLNKYGISSLHATMPINFKNNSKDTFYKFFK